MINDAPAGDTVPLAISLPAKPLAIAPIFLEMLILLTCASPANAQISPAPTWVPAGETSTPRPDYRQPQYWMMTPQNPRAHPVDVLFFHTTTFWDPNYVDPATGAHLTAPRDPAMPQVWNQTTADAIAESAVGPISNTQVSVFAASCNIYAPFYRQAALPLVLRAQPAAAAGSPDP